MPDSYCFSSAQAEPLFHNRRHFSGAISTAFCLVFLAACGGGSGEASSTPPPATYSVGGTVNNLAGSGLTLSNGIETVAVPANATSLSFPTKLTNGATYSVRIVSQPWGFTSVCNLSDASGTVSNADIKNISVSCHAASAVVTTYAGSSGSGQTNGPAATASFNYPRAVTVDAAGNVYVADWNNDAIRKITSDGNVSTLAGGGPVGGSTNATGILATFNSPWSVAADASGNVYVADDYNYMVRKVTSASVVTTFAGNGTVGNSNGTGIAATFGIVLGVAVDTAGNVYVSDSGNNLIRKITSQGVVSTLAGSGAAGHTDSAGTSASFNDPQGLAVDSSGNVYVADVGNYSIRKITPAGVVTTLANAMAIYGTPSGTGLNPNFGGLSGVAVDAGGYVYATDTFTDLILIIKPTGEVSTLAGVKSSALAVNQPPFADGIGTAASFQAPGGVAIDSTGNLYIADSGNSRIRKISPQ